MTMQNEENLIPIMTSNTEPFGVAFASQSFSDFYQAYKIFDKIIDSSHSYINNGTMPTFFGYEFIQPVIVNKISVTGRISSLPEQSLKDFQIQAYNEKENKWNILKDVINEPSWKNGEKREYSFSNNKAYKKYRIYCTSAQGTGFLTITEMEMFGYISSNKYLIKQDNNYYTIKSEFYKDGKFTPIAELDGKELLTKEDYDTYGFDSVNDLCTNMTINEEIFKPIDKLNDEFDLRMFKEK